MDPRKNITHLPSGMDDLVGKPVAAKNIREVVAKSTRDRSDTENAIGRVDHPGNQVAHDETPIDFATALANLGGDRELFDEVLATFFNHLPEAIRNLREAAAKDDAGLLEAAAHSLKGACANLCAEPVRRRVEQLEQQGKRGATEGADDLIADLEEHLDRLTDFVETLNLGSNAAAPPTTPSTAAIGPPETYREELECDTEPAARGRAATVAEEPPVCKGSTLPGAAHLLNSHQEPDTVRRILVVDDNPTNLVGLEKSLRKAGYEVLIAQDGRSAVDLATRHVPHLILLDMMLPDQSGLDVCRILKSQPETASIPIVFVTGQSESHQIVDAFAAGGCDYVTKPFRIDEVLARVTVHIQLLQTQHELAAKNAQLKFLASQLVDLNVQLGHDARIDSLTKLLNRRAWTESANLEHELSERHAHNFCVIMIDVDHFKLFNDTLGHPAGDDCLQHVGAAILRASRETDLIGRYGGEEFVVLAPNTDRDTALQLAERIRQTVWDLAIAHPSVPSGGRITVSVGVATHERDTLERVILQADRALYRAKDAGRNRVFATEGSGTTGAIPADHPTEKTQHTQHDPVHVLVADDNPTNRLIYKRTLEREGYEVREAADGAAALEAIAESPPDVIIMDVMMPHVDGLECTRRLKANPATRDIPVIVVSGKTHEKDIVAGLEAGANEYLTKPVRAAELALRVGSMATHSRNRIELLNQYTEIIRSNEVRGEQARALGTLLTLSRGLATATSSASVYDQIITATAELTGCRRISIMLPDESGDYLTIVDTVGMASSIADSVRVPIGSAIAGQVFATGRAVVANTPDEASFSENHYDSQFFVSTPLASKALTATERSVGVLNITDRLEGRAFSENELEYLDVLCNLAGAAINSLRSAEARDAALDSIVIALATLAEHRDTDTGLHLNRVTQFALLLAGDLRQTDSLRNVIDDAYLDDLKRAIPLHDIGKVAIPDAILLKPGKLTVEEMDAIKRHPEFGAKTIRPIMQRAPDARFLKMAELIALSHHEWYDGSGYPRGLVGDGIPLAARIAAVADVYDALTTRRSYKDAFSHEKAVGMIRDESGTHFDPLVVDSFLCCEREFAQLAEELRDELDSREDVHTHQS